MTYLEVVYRYQTPPGETELRAIDSVREVYGIQRISSTRKSGRCGCCSMPHD